MSYAAHRRDFGLFRLASQLSTVKRCKKGQAFYGASSMPSRYSGNVTLIGRLPAGLGSIGAEL